MRDVNEPRYAVIVRHFGDAFGTSDMHVVVCEVPVQLEVRCELSNRGL